MADQYHQAGGFFDVFAEISNDDRFVYEYDRGIYYNGESAAADDRRSIAAVCLESGDLSEEEIFEYEGSMLCNWEEYLDCLAEAEDEDEDEDLDGRLSTVCVRSDESVGSEIEGSEEEIYEYDSGMHSNSEYDPEILDEGQNLLDEDRFTAGVGFESGGLEEEIYAYDSGIYSNGEAYLESSSAADNRRSTADVGLESGDSWEEAFYEYEGRIYSNWEEYLDCLIEEEELVNERRSTTGIGSESGSEEESSGSENGGSEDEMIEYDTEMDSNSDEEIYEYDSEMHDDLVILADGQNFLYDRTRFTAGVGSESEGTLEEETDEYNSEIHSHWEEHLDSLAGAENFANTTRFDDVGLEGGGLSEEEISRHLTLITKNCGEDDDEICTVCLDDLCKTDAKVGVLECRHEYHFSCIKKWLQKKNVCPVCKRVAIPV